VSSLPTPSVLRWVVPALLLVSPLEAAARCPEQVAVLPVAKAAAGRSEAVAAEEALRASLERLVPGCAQARVETVRRLQAQGGMPACVEDACRAVWLGKLGVNWIVQGVAVAAGGQQTLALSLWGAKGQSGRRLVSPAAESTLMQRALAELWSSRTPRPGAPPRLGLLPHLSLGAGVAAIGTGVVLGVLAGQTQRAVSTGTAGCPPEDFSACFQRRVATGHSQAFWANTLMVGGVAVAGSGALLLVWTLP